MHLMLIGLNAIETQLANHQSRYTLTSSGFLSG
jgi:hypothetical protein